MDPLLRLMGPMWQRLWEIKDKEDSSSLTRTFALSELVIEIIRDPDDNIMYYELRAGFDNPSPVFTALNPSIALYTSYDCNYTPIDLEILNAYIETDKGYRIPLSSREDGTFGIRSEDPPLWLLYTQVDFRFIVQVPDIASCWETNTYLMIKYCYPRDPPISRFSCDPDLDLYYYRMVDGEAIVDEQEPPSKTRAIERLLWPERETLGSFILYCPIRIDSEIRLTDISLSAYDRYYNPVICPILSMFVGCGECPVAKQSQVIVIPFLEIYYSLDITVRSQKRNKDDPLHILIFKYHQDAL